MIKISNSIAATMRQTLVGKDYKLWNCVRNSVETVLSLVDYLIVYLDYAKQSIEVISFMDANDCYDEFQKICTAAEELSFDENVAVSFPGLKEYSYNDECDYDYGTGMQLKDTDGAIIASAYMINPDYYEN